MSESTTQHDLPTQDDEAQVRVPLEKSSGTAHAETTVETAETSPARKRGRRARRAAAAAREQEEAQTEGVQPVESLHGQPVSGGATKGNKAAGATKATDPTKGTGAKKSAAATETGDAAASGVSSRFRRNRRGKAATGTAGSGGAHVLTRVISGLLVVAVLLAALLLVQLIKGPGNGGKIVAREDRREAARQAADTVIPKLYSYDYRQIDANIAEQGQLTTGAIGDQIRTDTAPALKQLAPKLKAVVQAVSLGSAVTDDSGSDVQVLVFLNQAVNSSLLPAPRLDRNRVLATMRLVDGQWKVADIKAL